MRSYAEIPSPRGHWLYGNLTEFRRGRLKFYERLRHEFGTMAAYRLGPLRVVLVSEPTAIREILVTNNRNFGRSFSTRMLKDFFGEGLLISEGRRWLKDRRLIQPTFAAEQVRNFAEPMVRQTAEFIDSWSDGGTRDALLDMQSLTMAIAAETLLGVRLSSEVHAIHEPHELIRKNFDRRMESLLTVPKWIPTRYNRRVESANRSITEVVDRLIAKRRETRDFGPDILSRLMLVQDTEAGMDDQQLRNQALTFLFAGHETTASMIAWIWYLLSQHPEVERKLHAELDEKLGGRLPGADDAPRLKYTERVVRETLRLYPSAYVMGRRALQDCELAGYRIRKGCNLVISPWVMQRDPQFYQCPTKFDPDRWSDEFERQLDQFAWFPFGAGPRICIGKSFAMLEAVLLLATVASRFQLELLPAQSIKPYASVTIRPSPGVRVVVRRRACARGVNDGCQAQPATP